MSKTQSCLSENDLRELEHNQLSQQQLEQFEDHLTDCDQCREIFDASDIDPLPQWQSEICPALRETFDVGLSPTRAAGTARHETLMSLLSPSEDPRMLGRIGNYEVVGIIGQGGMGVVFKAFETSLNRFVAIKMLLPSLTANGAARKRFLREAQAAAAVVDDHVLPIFGVDQWQETPYLVMKYSGGQTLQQRIGQQGPLELKEVLRIGMQAAKGLAAAHAQGLVHRDVKPSNILLDGGVERAVLMDFGLARAVDDASITRTGIISGTPQYMSPEQVRADSVDARSDLFSLGSTLYAMCAGRPPFRADSAYGVMHRITHEEPTPICEVNSEVPQWMGNVIERLMSKTAEDRFQSADEVAQLLEDCLAHVQQPTTTKLPEVLAPANSSGDGASSWGKWLALATFAFLLAFGGIFLSIELNKGKLVIECASDNVPIRIMQGDVEVEKLNVSKEGKTIKIAAGTYVVEVDGDSDNIAAEGNTVLLSRGGVETVKIELKKNSDPVAGGWAPPENPDPNEILREAEEDRRSGKYQQALEKHLWYHENALRIDPGQGGVRLSFALNSWLELGEKYPPALAKMREVRDATEDKIRDQDRVRVKFEDFHDFSAFNNTLRQPSRTAALFKWLDGENSEDAAIVYPVAEAALIDQQEYKICGKYVDPTENVKQIHDRYVTGVKMSAEFGEHHLKHTEDALVNASSTLVEILVMNDRKTEAQTAADSLKKLIKGKALSTKLEKEISRVMKRQRTNSVAETWTPPENPDPKKILSEAQEDKRSGNYQRALTKHLWYHENALRIQPSLTGVRTSFALSYWLDLGEEYPPALAKMREIRDALEAKIRDENQIRTATRDQIRTATRDFADFKAFNRTLRQQQRTVELFFWLDKVDPEFAARVYHRAQPALLKQKEYEICGKYVNPIIKVGRICDSYDRGIKMSSKFGGDHLDYVKRTFVKDSSTLVEILVNNDRQAEAKETASSLKKFAEGKDISAQLEKSIDAAMVKKKPMKSPSKAGGGQGNKGDVKVLLDPDTGQVTLIGDKADTAQVAKAFDALGKQTVKATAEGNAAAKSEMVKDEQKQDTDPIAQAWTPPEDPDPKKILEEAKEDRESGNYQTSLAKHVWYHENARRIQPTGFRASPAMSHWLKLGEKYPPALDKMREIREATELKIRDKDRIRVKSHDFDDFVTLNRALQKDHLTAEFFVWLDRVDPEDAVRLYRSAQHALVKEGKYKICSKYVDPKDIEILCTYYKETLKRPSEFNEYRDKEFLEYGTCLIQVLATNGRKAEAQEAAASLKKCVAGTEISARLSEAVDAALEKKPAS